MVAVRGFARGNLDCKGTSRGPCHVKYSTPPKPPNTYVDLCRAPLLLTHTTPHHNHTHTNTHTSGVDEVLLEWGGVGKIKVYSSNLQSNTVKKNKSTWWTHFIRYTDNNAMSASYCSFPVYLGKRAKLYDAHYCRQYNSTGRSKASTHVQDGSSLSKQEHSQKYNFKH